MDIQANFLNVSQCVKTFWDRTEKDVRIFQFGYHDFSKRAITPQTFLRKQEFYTIHLVLSGKGRLNFKQKSYDLEGGDIFVLPPDQLFSYYPDSKTPWSYIFFVIYGDMIKDYLTSVGFSDEFPVKRCQNPKKLLPSFLETFEKMKNNLPTFYFETAGLLFQLLNAATDNTSPIAVSQQPDIVREAMTLIELKFLDSDLTVESISEALHVSHSWLCATFKAKTGTTMIGYINEKRMKYAEDLLLTTNLKATKIAYMSGFNEYTYFLMQFKRRNKMTTLEFRNSLLKK